MNEPTEHPTNESAPLSDERLAPLATDGPWLYDESDGEVITVHGVLVAEVGAGANGELIAAAPALATEVQQLRDRVAALTELTRRWDEKADALLGSVRPGDWASTGELRCDEAYQVQQCASEIRAALAGGGQ
ncbi:hypothetical protein [Streptomyces bohaiensis]|uniref:Uncharacterized protein n=1 Tax=Streptomyces bohaiensis TaxID=1431344 RepID=A0ABX1C4P5_9ACTN|nr:hypothetical protein [Streptomyces bohaiensis]NJQ14189.1 hypothetical protein [Streptomyces bohaiensis]